MAALATTVSTIGSGISLVTQYLQHTLPSGHQNKKSLIHLLAPTVKIQMECDSNPVFSFIGKRKTLEDVDPLFSSVNKISINALKIGVIHQKAVVILHSNEHQQSKQVLDYVTFKFTTVKTKQKIKKIVHRRMTNNFQKSSPSTAIASSTKEDEGLPKMLSLLKTKEISKFSKPISFKHFYLPLSYTAAYLNGDLSSMQKLLAPDTLIMLKRGAEKTFGIESFAHELTAFSKFNADAEFDSVKIELIYSYHKKEPLIFKITSSPKSKSLMDIEHVFLCKIKRDPKLDRVVHIAEDLASPNTELRSIFQL